MGQGGCTSSQKAGCLASPADFSEENKEDQSGVPPKEWRSRNLPGSLQDSCTIWEAALTSLSLSFSFCRSHRDLPDVFLRHEYISRNE